MPFFHLRKRISIFGLLLLLILLFACAETPQRRALGGAAPAGRRFAQKECLDCHKKFADQYFGMKSVHLVVKQKKCEDCHLRHGLVPKLLLKKEGNEVCYPCHTKEMIGLNKPNVHTALKRGRCTSCHNPHASQTSHLLKAEGKEGCYQCHKKENYEKKVVHRAVQREGCQVCHFSHSSDQPDLLKRGEPSLCATCHDGNRPPFKKAHGEYPVSKASCTGCHNPHSSLQAKLLKTSVHNPVSEDPLWHASHWISDTGL